MARYVYIQTADRTVHFAHRTERGSSLSKTGRISLIPIVMAIDKFGEDLKCSEGRIDYGKISLINFMACSQFRAVICQIYCQLVIYRLKFGEKHIS